MKEKLRVIVEESDTKLGKLFDLVVQLLVVISLLSFSLETLPNLSKNQIFIEDYAHHPKELDTLISSVRHMYPSQKLTLIFQPHLFSRTKDFLNEFATVLSKVDALILLDI